MGVVTVVKPPSSSKLTSLSAARMQTGSQPSANGDAFLNSLIDRASAMVTSYCGTVFGLRTVAELFRLPLSSSDYAYSPSGYTYATPATWAYSTSPLVLTAYPVNVIQTVTEGGVDLDPSLYELDSGLLFRLTPAGDRTWWQPTVTVTYTAGYTLPTDPPPVSLPADIEAACLALVSAGYFSQANNPSVVMEQTEGVGRVQYSRNPTITTMTLDASVSSLLSGYVCRVW